MAAPSVLRSDIAYRRPVQNLPNVNSVTKATYIAIRSEINDEFNKEPYRYLQ